MALLIAVGVIVAVVAGIIVIGFVGELLPFLLNAFIFLIGIGLIISCISHNSVLGGIIGLLLAGIGGFNCYGMVRDGFDTW